MAFSGITKFISQLTATESISDTDNLIVGNTDAKKITWAQIIALIKTKLNIGNTSLDGIGDGTLTGAVAELNSNIIPDYSQQTLLLNGNGEHTVSRSGRVQVYARNYAAVPKAILRLSINGKLVDETSGSSGTDTNYMYYMSGLYPVKKGDVIKVADASWSQQNYIYFYPCRSFF